MHDTQRCFQRLAFLATMCVAAIGWLAPGVALGEDRKPNIVVIFGDDIGLTTPALAAGPDTSQAGGRALDAEAQQAELAMKLQNPVADLISVPIQNNWDFGIGPARAMRYTANVQPVIPFSLTRDWSLITRTIVPVIYTESPLKGGGSTAGLGDILQSFFLTPKAPVGVRIIGARPVFSYPSATDEALGSEKFGLGPTAVLLQQQRGWTYGALVNHVWSMAGKSSRADVSATFLQPFLSYTTATHTTFGVNTESTYDWEEHQWTVPLNATASQLLKIGTQPFSLGIGARYYADKPAGGPDWGLRFIVTLLFAK
jgi:hypothetical protein